MCGVMLALVVGAVLAPSLVSADHTYPRVGNFFHNGCRPEYAAALSKWDIVGMDASIQDFSPGMAATLRSANPDIEILAYFPPAFIWAQYDTTSPTLREFGNKIADADWWLYDDKGNRIGEPGNLWYINLTSKCPVDGSGQTSAEWLAHYVADAVMGSGLWDGVLLDGLSEEIRWLNTFDKFFEDPPASVDCDLDGLADDPDSLDAWWKRGVGTCLATLRADVGPSAIIVPNGKNYFYQYANGGVRENFPKMHGGWEQNMFSPYGYIPMCQNYLDEPLNATMLLCYYEGGVQDIFTQPEGVVVDRFMRYTLTSALLGDGYYFFDGGRGGSIWWQDYYDLELGNPLGACYLDSIESTLDHRLYAVWKRDFQNATVFCNPYQQYVVLEGGTWLYPEDGYIHINNLPGPLGVALLKGASSREFDQNDRVILYEALVANGNPKAAQGYVWADLLEGGSTVVAGMPHEILVGLGDTDTLRAGLRVRTSLPLGTYTLRVSVGGFDRVPTDTDTMRVTKIVEFDRSGRTFDDANKTGYVSPRDESPVICSQPMRLSGESALTIRVGGAASGDDPCSIRLYDAAGRLVSTVYEGRLEDGLVLGLGGDDGAGAPRAPGVYFLHVQTRDRSTTRKIVLLR
jgi:hypothetical protein